MAKKVDELAEQLQTQGDDIKRILFLMEGDGLGGGIVPNLTAVKSDVLELKEWKLKQEMSKGKIDLEKLGRRFGLFWSGLKWAAAFIGLPTGVMALYKWAFSYFTQ